MDCEHRRTLNVQPPFISSLDVPQAVLLSDPKQIPWDMGEYLQSSMQINHFLLPSNNLPTYTSSSKEEERIMSPSFLIPGLRLVQPFGLPTRIDKLPALSAPLATAPNFTIFRYSDLMKAISEKQQNSPSMKTISVPLFRVTTPNLYDLSFDLISSPKLVAPHPLLKRAEEELIYVFDGDIKVTRMRDEYPQDYDSALRSVEQSVGEPGDLFFFPAERWPHTLHPFSDRANYLSIRYVSKLVEKGRMARDGRTLRLAGKAKKKSMLSWAVRHCDFEELDQERETANVSPETPYNCSATRWETPTDMLYRLLAVDKAFVPGKGIKPHVDVYDSIVIVEKGTLLIAPYNVTVTRGDMLIFPAGGEHGLTNVGATQTRHMLIELQTLKDESPRQQEKERKEKEKLCREQKEPKDPSCAFIQQ